MLCHKNAVFPMLRSLLGWCPVVSISSHLGPALFPSLGLAYLNLL